MNILSKVYHHRIREMTMRQFKTSKSITPRESNAIKTYLHEIGKTELLKPDEEVSLSQKIRA